MWERRYGFPSPARNSSGIRVYSDAEVERLVLVARSLKAGYRAGEVIHREPDDLKALLQNSAQPRFEQPLQAPTVQSLLETLARDDADGLRTELRQAVATLGPHRFLVEVADPLVEAVGNAWEGGQLDVRHEHLLTEALSTQLRLLLSAYEEGSKGPAVLLTTLSGEQHGLGIEMVALYLAVHGAVPRLLGVDTPPDQIVEAARALGSNVVGVSVSAASDLGTTAGHLRWMLGELPQRIRVWVGGRRARDISLEDARLDKVITWSDLDRALDRLKS